MNGKQRRYLRSLAHHLDPIVMVGQQGITEAVLLQVDTALDDHELIKVKLRKECPVERNEAAEAIATRTTCEVAGIVGGVLMLYRPRQEEPRIRLP
jgi:RNA-binding protein